MDKVVHYYFAPMSPWTYFGHQRLAAMAERHWAKVLVKPVDLGRIFPLSGGLPVGQRAPQRQAYRLVELARWRDYLGVPLNIHPKFFPVNGDAASKLILAAGLVDEAAAMRLAGACLQAVWAEDRNIADADTLSAIAREQGLDPAALRAREAEAAARYAALTDEAIALQVFGAPTYAFDGLLYWGQDRLEFLDRALQVAR
jgi:2-hydroxychromene-2-carboxylate isomerase